VNALVGTKLSGEVFLIKSTLLFVRHREDGFRKALDRSVTVGCQCLSAKARLDATGGATKPTLEKLEGSHLLVART
jgi:hypothetical protein